MTPDHLVVPGSATRWELPRQRVRSKKHSDVQRGIEPIYQKANAKKRATPAPWGPSPGAPTGPIGRYPAAEQLELFKLKFNWIS
jgi:hypothetical protein